MIFCSMNRVEAADELLCTYSKDGYNYYLYQTDGIKPYVVKMKKDDNNYYIYGKITLDIKSGNLDSDGYLKGCPKAGDDGYVTISNSKVTIKKNADLSAPNRISEYSKKGYSSWNCNYQFTYNKKEYKVSVNQSKYGFVDFTISKDGKDVSGKNLLFYQFNFGSFTCPMYFASGSYTGDATLKFYKDKDSLNAGGGNVNFAAKCSGSGCDSSNSGGSNTSLVAGNYCAYKNFGDCTNKKWNEGDCSYGSNDGKITMNSYFARSSYMFYAYGDSKDDIIAVYLPKDIPSTNSDIGNAYNKYLSGNKSKEDLEELLNKYFVQYSASDFTFFDDSFKESFEENEDGCKRWYNNTSGASGYDYEDTNFWFQYENTDPEDNDIGSNQGDEGSGNVIEEKDGPYFCVYNVTYGTTNKKNGEVVLKYNNEKTLITVFSNDFSGVFHSYTCRYDDCKNPDGVSFSGYGGDSSESNPDGLFQRSIVAGTCPKYIGYLQGILNVCNEDSNSCLKGEASYFGEFSYFTNNYDSNGSDEIEENCDSLLGDLKVILKGIFNFVRVIIPLIVLVLGIIDFASAIFASKEDDMKKVQSKFIKRLIICVAFFLVPTFINLLLDIADNVWGWTSSDCVEEIINND